MPVALRPRYDDDGRLAGVTGRSTARPSVVKRTIADLAEWPYPSSQLVPLTEVVHDRLNVEVFRAAPGAAGSARPG